MDELPPLLDRKAEARPSYRTQRVVAGGAAAEWGIAAEVPVEINLNGRPVAVMMATPADLVDLAIGFVMSEGLIQAPGRIWGAGRRRLPEGVIVELDAKPEEVRDARIRPRFLEGRSGCGLCGVETLADAIREVRPRAAAVDVDDALVLAAFDELQEHQQLNAATRSVHAAAAFEADGTLVVAREDVGRHNALDKVIGVLELKTYTGSEHRARFVVMTSRCSFELVQKCAMAGIGFLATASAPTTQALDLARAAGVRVVCRAGDAIARFDEDEPGGET